MVCTVVDTGFVVSAGLLVELLTVVEAGFTEVLTLVEDEAVVSGVLSGAVVIVAAEVADELSVLSVLSEELFAVSGEELLSSLSGEELLSVAEAVLADDETEAVSDVG